MAVYVLGSDGQPLMPCSEKRARLLLMRGRARVKRVKPFVIQLIDRNQSNSQLQDLEVKIDPGSKTTGICLSRTVGKSVNVINLMELEHRGQAIKSSMGTRRALRSSRRSRKTRHRQARFLNRTRVKGWLPPSLQHRVLTTMSWVNRLRRWCPITMLAVERVKFDMQKLVHADIAGKDYQHGELFEREVKEYLLEKYNRTCVYCGCKKGIFEIDHVHPKSKGGSNRISNLVLACHVCNQAKDDLPLEVFLADRPILAAKIKAQLKLPLKDAAAVNATRNALFMALLQTGLPVATGTGAQTKYNRSKLKIPKTHALDATCVGEVERVTLKSYYHLAIKAMGRGRYNRTTLDKYGFARSYLPKSKKVFGFATGDIIKTIAKTPIGLLTVIGRVVVKTTGYFIIPYKKSLVSSKWSNCRILQHNDGYSYGCANYNFIDINSRLETFIDK